MPTAAPSCDGLSVTVGAPIAREWSGALLSAGSGTAIVHWCGPGVVAVEHIEIGEIGERVAYELDPSVCRLGPGESLRARVAGARDPGTASILVRGTTEDGRIVEARGEVISVDDPDRLAAMAACEACAGIWAPVGMSQTEACDCPTSDGGQRCLRQADCQAACILDGDELAPAGSGPSCAAGEELRRRVGHCHDRQLLFGCHSRIADITLECVRPGALRQRTTVCVD